VILLDTHVLLWLDRDDPALGAGSRAAIESAWKAGAVAVSAISFWEVAMLQIRGRIVLPQPSTGWRLDWLEAGLLEHQLDGATAMQAAALDVFHPDPADRFIVATAIAAGATLVTADQSVLGWPGPLLRQDARA